MSIRKETPCDYGECPYAAEYYSSCEYWCGAEEPQDDPEIWERESPEAAIENCLMDIQASMF